MEALLGLVEVDAAIARAAFWVGERLVTRYTALPVHPATSRRSHVVVVLFFQAGDLLTSGNGHGFARGQSCL